MSRAKNGRSSLFSGLFHAPDGCTYTPRLSTRLHLRFSYRMIILLIVVSIVFCYQKCIICEKVQALPKLTEILLCECETSGEYWDKHKLEGPVYSSNLTFRKYIPRAINSPLPSRNLKVATIAMSM